MNIVNYLRQLFFIEEKEEEDIFFECEECGDIVVEQVEQAKQDDDCDFCVMVGVDICCLHRTGKTFGMAALSKTTIVNSDTKCRTVTINYDGYIFTAVFSNVSNRWVLVYEDEYESDDEGEYEDESYDRQMYRMYLNMTKAVKDDRWTFTEYKAVVARDKARINNR